MDSEHGKEGSSPSKARLVRISEKAGDPGSLPQPIDVVQADAAEVAALGREAASAGSSMVPPAVRVTADLESAAEEADEEVRARALDSLSPRSRTYTEGLNSGLKMRLTRTVSLGKLLRYGVHSIQGLRPEMEDAHLVVLDVHSHRHLDERSTSSGDGADSSSDTPAPLSQALSGAAEVLGGKMSFLGVFDGHGGSHAAEFARECLCSALAKDFDRVVADPVEALRRAFARTEERWLRAAAEEELFDGTTAAVALLDRQRRLCVVGNVGDTEVMLGTRNLEGQARLEVITEVHHLQRSKAETQRVEALGGRIWKGRLGHPKINPKVVSLAVSRAIGDLFFKDDRYTGGKPSGLVAEPHVATVSVGGDDVSEQFLLLGCDGFWDTVSYETALHKVFELLDEDMEVQAISENLVRLAQDAGSSDNITVMVVVL